MHNILFQTICRTGIFMICAQTIVHFRPNESYEKYLKLLVSVMVLIQLFLPVGVFLAGVSGTGGSIDEFRESLEQSMEEARQQAAQTEAMLEKMTLEEVRRHIEEEAALREQTASEGQAASEEQAALEGRAASEDRSALAEQESSIPDSVGQSAIPPVEISPIDVRVEPIDKESGQK